MSITPNPPGGGYQGENAVLPEVKKDSLKRISYIEGHVIGIRRMLEQDQYCVDVLKQTFAVRRAIEKLEHRIMSGHLRTHVTEGIREGREDAVLEELLDLYGLASK